jgi:hypothetical protein
MSFFVLEPILTPVFQSPNYQYRWNYAVFIDTVLFTLLLINYLGSSLTL